MAFSGGGLSQSSSGAGASVDSDEVDDITEVDDADVGAPSLNAQVAARATVTRRLTEDAEGEVLRLAEQAEEYTPSARLAQVGQRSSEYEREYRLNLLHRLLLRNTPLDEVATALGVSVSTVMRDRRELADRLRKTSRDLDVDLIIGNSTGFYDEVQAMALRAASSGSIPIPMRLAGMRTALAAHNDKHRFYQAAGVYDVLRFRKGAGEGQSSDIQRLMAMTDEMLSEVRTERRSATDALGGFSGTDAEVLDL